MHSISYTAHALARMAERGVSRDQVEGVLAAPLRMPLRVIVERGVAVSVITVIATRKIDKYGVTA